MRKILRRIFLFLGVSAIALVFQACYGMPVRYDNDWEEDNSDTEYNDKSNDEEKIEK